MTEHFTREEAVALAGGLGMYSIDHADLYELLNAAVTAKLKEWEAQGALPVEYQYHYPDGSWRCSNGDSFNGMKPDCSRPLFTHALPAQPAEPEVPDGWQPMKTAPTDGRPVWVCWQNSGRDWHYCWAHFDGVNWRGTGFESSLLQNLICWVERPPAPQQQKEG